MMNKAIFASGPFYALPRELFQEIGSWTGLTDFIQLGRTCKYLYARIHDDPSITEYIGQLHEICKFYDADDEEHDELVFAALRCTYEKKRKIKWYCEKYASIFSNGNVTSIMFKKTVKLLVQEGDLRLLEYFFCWDPDDFWLYQLHQALYYAASMGNRYIYQGIAKLVGISTSKPLLDFAKHIDIAILVFMRGWKEEMDEIKILLQDKHVDSVYDAKLQTSYIKNSIIVGCTTTELIDLRKFYSLECGSHIKVKELNELEVMRMYKIKKVIHWYIQGKKWPDILSFLYVLGGCEPHFRVSYTVIIDIVDNVLKNDAVQLLNETITIKGKFLTTYDKKMGTQHTILSARNERYGIRLHYEEYCHIMSYQTIVIRDDELDLRYSIIRGSKKCVAWFLENCEFKLEAIKKSSSLAKERGFYALADCIERTARIAKKK
jgi:hypothetical protein